MLTSAHVVISVQQWSVLYKWLQFCDNCLEHTATQTHNAIQ